MEDFAILALKTDFFHPKSNLSAATHSTGTLSQSNFFFFFSFHAQFVGIYGNTVLSMMQHCNINFTLF